MKTKKALKTLGLAKNAKNKTSSLAAKKSAPKAAAKKVVKTTAVKAAVKSVAKTAAKKPTPKAPTPAKKVAAPLKGKAPVKDTKKKTAVPVPAKPTAKIAKPTKAPEPAAKEVKGATKTTAAKAAAPKTELASAPEKVEAPKAAKLKKGRAVEVVEAPPEEEIVLLDAEGRRYCRVRECDQASAVDGYCRYHYLLFWKNIQVRKKILSEGKLERYIEELTARYPDKYLEMLKKDLRSEKEFLAAIQELEIDEAGVDNEYEDEAQNYLDEVRGTSSELGSNDRDEEF